MRGFSFFVLASLSGTCLAQGTMYCIDSGRAFSTVDIATGTKTLLGTVSANAGTTGALAYDCSSNTIYLSSTGNDSLYTLNPVTFEATLVGSYGDSTVVMHGLEIDSSTGNLYGGSAGNLYSINKATGLATLIGSTGLTTFTNLGYNAANNTMYMSNSGTDSFYSIDLNTAAATLIGPLNGPTNPNGLAFNPDNGQLYLICNTTDTLYTMDLATGTANVVGSMGAGNLLGLVYVPDSCGEPACPADLADATGAGNPDGGVDINDLIFFLTAFEAGNLDADLDNGTSTGTPDQAVDINDLLYFLVRFEAGC